MQRIVSSFLILLGLTVAASAADYAPAPAPMVSDPLIDELRLGLFAHDPWSPEHTAVPDLNVEVLFAKPWGTRADWWLPRPHIGATIDFDGKTSAAYAGATWQYDVTSWAFIEATFGGSVNNGETKAGIDGHNALGCNVLFRESASLGFEITENWRIIGTVEHSSNAGLCSENRGLTNAGVRIGYKF